MADELVVCAGYSVVDVVVDAGRTHAARAGGTAANVAANLRWLGTSEVALAARVGADPAGRLIQAEMQSDGVSVEFIHLDPQVQTPVLIHEVTGAPKEPRYLFTCPTCHRTSATFRPITTRHAHAVASPIPALFFFDRASAAALEIAYQVRQAGGIVMFEPNTVGRENLTARAVQLASIVKVSSGRGDRLLPLLDLGLTDQVQICTSGAEGLRWRRYGQTWHYEPGQPASVRDASGAGDWLTSGLLYNLTPSRLAHDTDLRDALARGQGLAALSCEYVGARGLAAAYRLRIRDRLSRLGIASSVGPRALAGKSRPIEADVACNVCLAPRSRPVRDDRAGLAAISK